MNIERKFKMFSTKEWIQYLQYKLSPEREKELESQLVKDPFLNEAVTTIGDKENRAQSYQSISLLINEVQHYTGVSESKILKSKETSEDNTAMPIDWKLVSMIAGGLFLLGMLGYGIYYFLSSSSGVDNEEQTMVEAESVSNIQSYADSSSRPLEVIPNAVSAASTPLDTPVSSVTKPVLKKPAIQGSNNVASSTQLNSASSKASNSSAPNSPAAALSQKERELFNQAQEIYKQGNREEAKRILRELKSYDNPMKSQAETILKNMEN
ncbi:MAG: hypothetical protein ACK5UE_03580 [Chitinophagales bacterium]|jgi:hypothetical protein|nr:hypothetical protein [Sphingobacteriales bacterium]